MNIKRITYNDQKEKELDEVLISDIDSVHIERMDDGHIWVVLNSGDDRLVVEFWTKRNGKILGHAESK